MNIVKSREKLNNSECSAYPHLSDDGKKSYYKKLYDLAYPRAQENKKVYNTQEAWMFLKKATDG